MGKTAGSMSSPLIAASDITLQLDRAGVIRSVTLGQLDQPLEEVRAWVGQGWTDTVTAESRPRVITMLAEALAGGVSHRRDVDQVLPDGGAVPVSYTVVRIDEKKGQVLALGRDLRAFSALQQRLIEAQQSLERDYWRMRHLEARYRLLFQLTTEPVLMIDAVTHKVIEANPAAALLFDQPTRRLAGRTFPFDIDAPSEALVAERLAMVRSLGRADDIVVQLTGSGRNVTLAMSLMRQDSINLCLVRLLPASTDPVPDAGGSAAAMALRLIEALPDGFVVSDTDGRIVLANRSFLDMVELATLQQARGRLLSEWIGRPGADLSRFLGLLSEHGTIRLAGTTLRGELGAASEVEVSATAVTESDETHLGFLVREVARRLEAAPRGANDLGHAVEQLTSLVGKISLKDLVRDTTALVERRFITAALDTTRDNRSSAAELLGLSRQSLYMKLKRHELGEHGSDGITNASHRKLRKTRKH